MRGAGTRKTRKCATERQALFASGPLSGGIRNGGPGGHAKRDTMDGWATVFCTAQSKMGATALALSTRAKVHFGPPLILNLNLILRRVRERGELIPVRQRDGDYAERAGGQRLTE